MTVQQNSPELAKELEKFKLLDSEEFSIFWDLYIHLRLIIKKGTNTTPYLTNDYMSIHNDIGKLKDKKTAIRLQELLELAGGLEIKYLKEQLYNLQTMNSENLHLKSNLGFYIKSFEEGMKKINVMDRYLLKNIKEIDNKNIILSSQEINFLDQNVISIKNWGLNENKFMDYVKILREILKKIRVDYKDQKLFSEFLLTDIVKKLVFFVEEYNYIKNIYNLIEKSYTSEKDWHDFINLVNNANKISSALSLKFGDKNLGTEIEEFAKKNKDDIKAWKEYISNIIEKEFKSVIRQKEIAAECQKAALDIIIRRKSELENELKNSDKSIENFIGLRIKQLEGKKENALSEMFRTVKEEVKITIKQIKEIYNHVKEYENKIREEWQKKVVDEFLEKSEQLKEKQMIWVEKHLDLKIREDKENASLLFLNLNRTRNSANSNLSEFNKMNEELKVINVKDASSAEKIENVVRQHMGTIMDMGGILGMSDVIEIKAGIMIEKGLNKLLNKIVNSINASNEIIVIQREIINYHKKIVDNYFNYENKDYEKENDEIKGAA